MPYDETYRPHFHFSPAAHWLNDPNGLVFYEGEYHLFYQHYPAGTTHGPMHWGHAVAADLVNWTHMPIALYPDRNGYIYSGSAVIDWHDTAGFGLVQPQIDAIGVAGGLRPESNLVSGLLGDTVGGAVEGEGAR